ncbi:MAG: cupin domain-containing protein [Anaeromyxobacteraceae bacterium]
MPTRPPFIVSAADVPETVHRYPRSEEGMAPSRAVGRVAGLLRIGVHLVRVPPGTRTSFPHAEEDEEEFVYVVEGEVDAWVDGALHRMRAGDLAAFPAGTGICHTFINDGDRDAVLLSGGEANKADSRIHYPLDPGRRGDMPWSRWWDDVPQRPQGPHDGRPARR